MTHHWSDWIPFVIFFRRDPTAAQVLERRQRALLKEIEATALEDIRLRYELQSVSARLEFLKSNNEGALSHG